MRPNDIIKEIGEEYPLIVRNEHHVQIEVGEGRFHDLWIAERGMVLKVKFHGNQRIDEIRSLNYLRRQLQSYSYESTNLADLKSIQGLIALAARKPGIWVDAGWKKQPSEDCSHSFPARWL